MKKLTRRNKKVDYEQIGRMVESIYLSGYIDRNQLYKMSFIKGLVTGFGGVIGATIVVALLLWVLSIFNEVPLIGNFTEKIKDTVQTDK